MSDDRSQSRNVAETLAQPGADVYRVLGVPRVINAAGTITAYGGSLMPPEVLRAWQAAAGGFVRLEELQEAVGSRIARCLRAEAAMVTSGAAGAITLATAAALTLHAPQLAERLPLSPDKGFEVIRQRTHRDSYDRQVRACGVRLVDVGSRAELLRTIGERTVLMFSYNVREAESAISQDEWLAIARDREIPTLLDAAADTPPVDALFQLTASGFDLVAISGGKAIRGPQDTGLLLGRRDLIEAARSNAAPRTGTIGRAMKVSKEDMVALAAAIDRYLTLDADAEWRGWQQKIERIENGLRDLPGLRLERIVPPIANRVPHLIVDWDSADYACTPAELQLRLENGSPPIVTARVHGTGDRGLLLSVFMLQEGEEEVVARRLRAELTTARRD